MQELHLLFNSICEFKQRKSDHEISEKPIRELLRQLKSYFEKNLTEIGLHDFSVKIPGYFGHLPNVLYVCILPPHQKVSNGIYAALCFDIHGRGALAGCVGSKKVEQNVHTMIRKKTGTSLSLDVDGASTSTKYNNQFINPEPFFYPLHDEKLLLAHLFSSFQRAVKLLSESATKR